MSHAAAAASTGNGHDQDDEADVLCPVCLTEFPPLTWRGTGRNRYLCCGKAVCDNCHSKICEQGGDKAGCPFCQSAVAVSDRERVRRVRAHADSGKPWALTMLGDFHKNGIGTRRNPAFAVECYRKAAEMGYTTGQQYLGECYLFGIGTERDVDEAAAWFERAAAAGYPSALHALGSIVGGSSGPSSSVPIDHEREFQLFTRAAEQDYPPSQEVLAQLYEDGTPGLRPPSLERSIFWRRKAAMQGFATAQTSLSGSYLRLAAANHGSIDCAMPIALFWLKKAAANGDAEGTCILREMQAATANKCSHCGVMGSRLPSPLLKCSRCKEALYCSVDHQKKHWKVHKCWCELVKTAEEELEQAKKTPPYTY
jgi:TPR repeat protein